MLGECSSAAFGASWGQSTGSITSVFVQHELNRHALPKQSCRGDLLVVGSPPGSCSCVIRLCCSGFPNHCYPSARRSSYSCGSDHSKLQNREARLGAQTLTSFALRHYNAGRTLGGASCSVPIHQGYTCHWEVRLSCLKGLCPIRYCLKMLYDVQTTNKVYNYIYIYAAIKPARFARSAHSFICSSAVAVN